MFPLILVKWCYMCIRQNWGSENWARNTHGYLLLLLSCFSRVRLCATPQMAAHQAPPSLGFSRQEHWSGLPFPSPMLESEKWKWSHSVMSDPQRPHGLQPTRLLRPWDFPGESTGVGCHCLLHSHSRRRVKWLRRERDHNPCNWIKQGASRIQGSRKLVTE